MANRVGTYLLKPSVQPLIYLSLDLRVTAVQIFCIDVSVPTITPWAEIIMPDFVEPISLNFDILAISWMGFTTGRIFTRIANIAGKANKEIVMDLGTSAEVSQMYNQKSDH